MSDEITVLPINLIVSNPQVRSGRPIIAGTGLRVQDVVAAHHLYRHESIEYIVENYSRLNLAQVYAALAYYYDHKAEMDAQMAADEAFVDKMMEEDRARRNSALLRREYTD